MRTQPDESTKADAHGRAMLCLQAIEYILGRVTTTSVELRFMKAHMLKHGDEKDKDFATNGLHTLEDVIEETAKRLYPVAEYLADVYNETDMHGNSPEDKVLETIFEVLNPEATP